MVRRHWLTGVVLLAATLRFFPIWFGLEHPRVRPDEETAVGHAVQVLAGHFNPGFFHWPSLIFYVLAALYGVASLVRRALLLDPALTASEYLLIGRAFVAVAGTLTVVVLFRMGRRLSDATTGLLAALLLAVSILHVRDSHFAMTDVVMTLLVFASLALLHASTSRRSRRTSRSMSGTWPVRTRSIWVGAGATTCADRCPTAWAGRSSAPRSPAASRSRGTIAATPRSSAPSRRRSTSPSAAATRCSSVTSCRSCRSSACWLR